MAKRINIDGDFLIISPNIKNGSDYHHILTEREFLVNNILNFLDDNIDIECENITIYELVQVNGSKERRNNGSK